MHVADLVHWWRTTSTTELIWIGVGLLAQLLFTMRFFVQWVATEKARINIVPETFWYFSFFGGILLLAYACYRVDPGLHPWSGDRPRDLFPQYLFHLARQAGAKSGQGCVSSGSPLARAIFLTAARREA